MLWVIHKYEHIKYLNACCLYTGRIQNRLMREMRETLSCLEVQIRSK